MTQISLDLPLKVSGIDAAGADGGSVILSTAAGQEPSAVSRKAMAFSGWKPPPEDS